MGITKWKHARRTGHSGVRGSVERRLIGIQVVFVICMCALVARLVDVQLVQYEKYKALAQDTHVFERTLLPARGEIFVKDRYAKGEHQDMLLTRGGERVYPGVMNKDYVLISANPKLIEHPGDVAEKLARLLGVDGEVLLGKLSKKDDAYEVLKKKVDDEVAEKVKALGMSGIYFQKETYRHYPDKGLGGHVFGYVGYAGDHVRGLYGLEGYFQEMLQGKQGVMRGERDPLGALIPVGKQQSVDAIHGSELILTIDRTVQTVTCTYLQKWVLQHGADGGSVVIVDPRSGAIIAMCSVPDYDPSEYGKFDQKLYSNPAIFTAYEPGSIFKPITMAMGLDMGHVDPSSTYVDTGKEVIASYTIRNSDGKASGRQTMTEVLNKSLNTGVIHVARKVGIGDFRKYVKEFGFGSLTGIQLDTEHTGNISALNENNEIYLATASFGQGITVTPLQMVLAFAAIANGGVLMQPYIVDTIIKPNGEAVRTLPKEVRRVISERTATLLSGMLVTVVEKGHGKRAGVPGYYVAGKTGTAQVAKKEGRGYEQNITIGSFAGFAPVDDPRFAMIVKIDRPRDVTWAESSAAPLFGQLADFLLRYEQVPYDKKIKKKK